MDLLNARDNNSCPYILDKNSTNDILISIATKQIRFADTIHNEAEKIKAALKKLKENSENNSVLPIKELTDINNNTNHVLSQTVKEKITLQAELDNINIHPEHPGKST